MDNSIKPIGLINSLLLFLIPGLLFWLHMKWTVPFLATIWPISSYATWLIVGTFLLFLPLLLLTLVLMKTDGFILDKKIILNRLFIKKIKRKDWAWIFGGILIAALLAGGMAYFLTILPLGIDFSDLKDISPIETSSLIGVERLFLLLLPVFFFFNYVGEEVLWRGYILPRQEVSFGRYAWLINGLFHIVFHLGFGLTAMIVSIPVFLMIPFVAYKTKNTTTAIIIHAMIGAPMQIMVALGFIS